MPSLLASAVVQEAVRSCEKAPRRCWGAHQRCERTLTPTEVDMVTGRAMAATELSRGQWQMIWTSDVGVTLGEVRRGGDGCGWVERASCDVKVQDFVGMRPRALAFNVPESSATSFTTRIQAQTTTSGSGSQDRESLIAVCKLSLLKPVTSPHWLHTRHPPLRHGVDHAAAAGRDPREEGEASRAEAAA